MHLITIINQSHPLHTPLKLKYCDHFLDKFKGLMGNKSLDLDQGIILVEENDSKINASIHMFFMKHDISVIWVNKDHVVVDTLIAKKWKPMYAPKDPACFTIEAHPDRLKDFSIGDRLEFQECEK